MNIRKTSQRIIAYLDVLGFSSLVKKSISDPSFENRILDILECIKDEKDKTSDTKEITVFSDNIVISYPADYSHAVLEILTDVSKLQKKYCSKAFP
jgi:hypothetical protein